MSPFVATPVSTGEIPYVELGFDFDPTYVVNDWQITRANGGTQTATDATSQRRYFRETKQLTLDVDTDAQTLAAAQHYLALNKDPHLRVMRLLIRPTALPLAVTNAWPACLGLKIGDCVRVNRRPPGLPTVTGLFVVQHISHSVSDQAWETEFSLTPADTSAYGFWDVGLWDVNVWAY